MKPRKVIELGEKVEVGTKDVACVPTVRVKLIQSICLLPNQNVLAEVHLTDCDGQKQPLFHLSLLPQG